MLQTMDRHVGISSFFFPYRHRGDHSALSYVNSWRYSKKCLPCSFTKSIHLTRQNFWAPLY
jgi:hypothetical protein